MAALRMAGVIVAAIGTGEIRQSPREPGPRLPEPLRRALLEFADPHPRPLEGILRFNIAIVGHTTLLPTQTSR